MTLRFSLIVFDWDGTLADSEARIVECIRHAVARMQLPEPAVAPREIIGLGMREAIETLYPGSDVEFSDRFAREYRARFLDAAATPVTLFPGAKEAVSVLRGGGRKIGVATGKSRRGLDRELAEAGIAGLVDASRCADEAPSKPHPEMLRAVMDELETGAEDTLMIGDTAYDMEMAAAAGVARIGVRTGVHPALRLLEFSPLAVLDSIAGLPAFLERI